MIEFCGISKRFPGVQALKDVSLTIDKGTCHALMGENGAGKSTLGKILAGIYAADEGEILIEGKKSNFANPRDARLAGIGMVYQELSFCENLSVAENLSLGETPSFGSFVLYQRMKAKAFSALQAIGCSIDVDAKVAELPLGQQQLVQIAGAVAGGANILIFDEPTSSLSKVESQRLMALIRTLKAKGVTCIYVSHRLEEIFEICDAVTVLRDGQYIGTRLVGDVSRDALIQMMVGRSFSEFFPEHRHSNVSKEILRVENLSSPGKFESVNFTIRAGEIVGIAGLVGSGRTEISEAIFGLDGFSKGVVHIDGKRVAIRSPSNAMTHGIGLIPEDRKKHGLVLGMTVMENISMSVLQKLSSWGWISSLKEHEISRKYFNRLKVKAPALETAAVSLSGGNQQKLVIAKWLAANCKILLVDEPTRGVDVGAKAEIHTLIDQLAGEGSAVLLISSELPELLNLSDRILVMRNGRINGEFKRDEADQGKILRLMTGTEP
jgi:ABC-type sugar transport system ATPase subunit